MDVIRFKMLEREVADLTFEIDEIADEITDADDDADVDALHERRRQLEQQRAGLQMRIFDLIR
jgi:hypothetical protein